MHRAPEHARANGDGMRVAGLLAVAMLAAGGAGMLLAALTLAVTMPPQPAASALAEPGAAKPAVQSQPSAQPRAQPPRQEPSRSPMMDLYGPRVLARSQPTRVVIPRIGVDAKILATGVDANGAIEVPPLTKPDVAGWYRFGPSPGEAGSAVIVGHVDSRKSGPAVFFELGALQRGDIIRITRADRSVVAFKVDSVEVYAKATFPADQVHRPYPYPALRLITCGGRFDRKQHNYLDNVIVFASLTARR